MKIALRFFLFMTVLLGVAYPALMTGIAQVLFPEKANGSLIQKNDKIIGSSLIAQSFKDPKYFWPRPSAVDYNPASSGASNLSATSQSLQAKVAERKAHGATGDLLYASASGLDPHISPTSARDQIQRISKARSFTGTQRERLIQLLELNTEKRQLGFLGEPRVNVLKMNLSLDQFCDQL